MKSYLPWKKGQPLGINKGYADADAMFNFLRDENIKNLKQ